MSQFLSIVRELRGLRLGLPLRFRLALGGLLGLALALVLLALHLQRRFTGATLGLLFGPSLLIGLASSLLHSFGLATLGGALVLALALDLRAPSQLAFALGRWHGRQAGFFSGALGLLSLPSLVFAASKLLDLLSGALMTQVDLPGIFLLALRFLLWFPPAMMVRLQAIKHRRLRSLSPSACASIAA